VGPSCNVVGGHDWRRSAEIWILQEYQKFIGGQMAEGQKEMQSVQQEKASEANPEVPPSCGEACGPALQGSTVV
jgi:hypothetical protein